MSGPRDGRPRTGSVFKEGGAWVARVSFHDGTDVDPVTLRPQRRFRKRRAATKALACVYRDEMLRELEEGNASPDRDAVVTFGDLARVYVHDYTVPAVYEGDRKISGMADHKGVRNLIEGVLIPALGHRPLKGLTYGDLKRFRDSRLGVETVRGVKRSLARVNREMSTVRRMLNIAVRERWISRNPMTAGESLVVSSGERQRDRILTPDEETAILARCLLVPPLEEDAGDAREEAGKPLADLRRLYLPLLVALDTGLRMKELRSIELRDIDLEARRIELRALTTKTKRSRVVAISKRLYAVIKERVAEMDGEPTGLLVPVSRTQIRDDFAKLVEETGVKDFQFRDTRHCYATRLMEGGMSDTQIQKLTGHTNVKTLRKHYLNVSDAALETTAAILDLSHEKLREHAKERAQSIN